MSLALLAFGSLLAAQQPQKIKINYPARTGTTWPLYIAKDGGYYAKYGLDVDLVFGVHPAGIAALGILAKDKAFAIKTYLAYHKEDPADVEKVYDRYTSSNVYERVPYILAPAVQYMIDHPADEQTGAPMRKFDFHSVLDNSMVDRLVKEGFFEKLFGPGIKAEEDRKSKIAFR
jgi:hypothetical protein